MLNGESAGRSNCIQAIRGVQQAQAVGTVVVRSDELAIDQAFYVFWAVRVACDAPSLQRCCVFVGVICEGDTGLRPCDTAVRPRGWVDVPIQDLLLPVDAVEVAVLASIKRHDLGACWGLDVQSLHGLAVSICWLHQVVLRQDHNVWDHGVHDHVEQDTFV